MRRVECLTGWGGGETYFEVESDLGIDDDDNDAPVVIVRLHAATSPGQETDAEAAPARIGFSLSWVEPTCAMTLAQARELSDALDAAIGGIE